MTNYVKVLAKDGQELMPTTLERANKLIQNEKAEFIGDNTIKMLVGTKRYTQVPKYDIYDYDEFSVPLGRGLTEEIRFNMKGSENTQSSLLIVGKSGTGKSTLIKNFINHVRSYNQEAILYNPFNEFYIEPEYSQIKHISDVNDFAGAIRKELSKRLNLLEDSQVNSIYKIPNNECKPLFIIIDDLVSLMNDENYRAVDIIKNCLSSIIRLGRITGIYTIMTSQYVSANVLSQDLLVNISSIIYLWKISQLESMILFDEDRSEETRDFDIGEGLIRIYNNDIEKFNVVHTNENTEPPLKDTTDLATLKNEIEILLKQLLVDLGKL